MTDKVDIKIVDGLLGLQEEAHDPGVLALVSHFTYPTFKLGIWIVALFLEITRFMIGTSTYQPYLWALNAGMGCPDLKIAVSKHTPTAEDRYGILRVNINCVQIGEVHKLKI